MPSKIITEKCQNESKLNTLSSTFADKGFQPINSKFRSKSLSSDKLNSSNTDRAAILNDEEAHDVSETPGCLARNKIMDLNNQQTLNG